MANKGDRTNTARRISDRRNHLYPDNRGQERRNSNRRGQKDKRKVTADLNLYPIL